MPVSPQLSPAELQCLLWLLRYPDYRAAAAEIAPYPKLSATRRDRLWGQLQNTGLVDFEVLVTRFGLSATGRTLLQLDRSILPVTPDEKHILQSCRDRSIHPDNISHKVPPDQRQILVQGLARQGLIRITQQKLGEIWLTPAGLSFLRYDCTPEGDAPAISGSLLSGYLTFMRRTDLVLPTPAATGDRPTAAIDTLNSGSSVDLQAGMPSAIAQPSRRSCS